MREREKEERGRDFQLIYITPGVYIERTLDFIWIITRTT